MFIVKKNFKANILCVHFAKQWSFWEQIYLLIFLTLATILPVIPDQIKL